jgi:hypothetical protein
MSTISQSVPNTTGKCTQCERRPADSGKPMCRFCDWCARFGHSDGDKPCTRCGRTDPSRDVTNLNGWCRTFCDDDGPADGNPDHGPYCLGPTRSVHAEAENTRNDGQIYVQAAAPYLNGYFTKDIVREHGQRQLDSYVLVRVQVDKKIVIEEWDPGHPEVSFILTTAQARSLARFTEWASDVSDRLTVDENQRLARRKDAA